MADPIWGSGNTGDPVWGTRNFPDAKPVAATQPESMDGEFDPIMPDEKVQAGIRSESGKLKDAVSKAVTPWGRAGITKQQYDALPLTDKLKMVGGQAIAGQLDKAKQGATALPRFGRKLLRAGSGIVQGALESSANKLESLQAGDKPSTLPVGLDEQTGVAPVIDNIVTPQGLRESAASLARATTSLDDVGGLYDATTPEGKLVNAGTDIAGDVAMAYASGGMLGAGAYMGASRGGETYQRGSELGLPQEQKRKAALGSGALNAAAGMMPLSRAFDPLGKALLGSRVGPLAVGALEGGGITAADQAIQQEQGYPQEEGGILTSAVLGAAIKGASGKINRPIDKGALPTLPLQMDMPQGGNQTRFGVEQLLNGQPHVSRGAELWRQRMRTELASVPNNVRQELYSHIDDLSAGLTPKPLSAEAQALMDNPAFQHIRKAEYDARVALDAQRGTERVMDPNFLHRVVVEGAEPTKPSGSAGVMPKATASDQARTMVVIEDPQGGRAVVNKDDIPSSYKGPVRQATANEIESQTDLRYRKDPIENSLNNAADMQVRLQNLQTIKAIQDSPFHSPESKPGWRQVSPKAQQVMGEGFFDPEVARLIEERIDTGARQDPTFLDKVKRGIVNIGFLNPTVHAPNMFTHGFEALGESVLHPIAAAKAWQRSRSATLGAQEGLANQDAIDIANARGQSMTRDLVGTRKKAVESEIPQSINKQAQDELSAQRPDTMEGGLGSGMNKQYTWTTDDKIRNFLYILKHESMKKEFPNATMADAVREVDRVYPSYHVERNQFDASNPVAQNTNSLIKSISEGQLGTLFNKYGIAASKSLATKVQDLLGAGTSPGVSPELSSYRQDQAIAKLGTLLAAYGLTKGPISDIVKVLTGNEKAESAGGGGVHRIEQVVGDVKKGDLKMIPVHAAGLTSITPEVALLNTLRDNTQKKIANPADVQDAKDFAASGQVPEAIHSAGNYAENVLTGVGKASQYSLSPVLEALTGTKDPRMVAATLFLRGKEKGTDAEEQAKQEHIALGRGTPPTATEADRVKAMKQLRYAAQAGKPLPEDVVMNMSPEEIQKVYETNANPREMQLAMSVKNLDKDAQIRVFNRATPKERAFLLLTIPSLLEQPKGDKKSINWIKDKASRIQSGANSLQQ